ncbi:helix-turn-helix domain-containing protein [Trinickia soli]|uniref:helix-turn-helix domain-containing protein n=1 Tax=Trinickia soli TaxID=380675 RepID=UPI0012517207|nr:XRE family transcriptional regulator [Paraburkholderia sp. T12-10]
MEKTLSRDAVAEALQHAGFSQAELARRLEVSSQAVTNWLKGKDFPRPDKLLKMSVLLRVPFDKLVQRTAGQAPVIAFRKRGGTKTTDAHLEHAAAMGYLLKSVVEFLPTRPSLRPRLNSPSLEYMQLQRAIVDVRTKLGVGTTVPLEYSHLIGQFIEAGAVLIPVLWGEKKRHENAVHICLPAEDITFIYLNLDTKLEDFKFWMAHELAHVYTPKLAGSDEGEDFADAFAGALLFPEPCAKVAYADAIGKSEPEAVRALNQHAVSHSISVYSVFCEVQKYQESAGLPPIATTETAIHKFRNGNASSLVSAALFGDEAPTAKVYVHACEEIFRCQLFSALRAIIKMRSVGPTFVHQVLDIPLSDASAIHAELSA